MTSDDNILAWRGVTIVQVWIMNDVRAMELWRWMKFRDKKNYQSTPGSGDDRYCLINVLFFKTNWASDSRTGRIILGLHLLNYVHTMWDYLHAFSGNSFLYSHISINFGVSVGTTASRFVNSFLQHQICFLFKLLNYSDKFRAEQKIN